MTVYELVPEAYHQRFRSRKKLDNQTYTELARDLISQFNRWCASSEAKTFVDLCNLMIREQLKNLMLDRVATYINEHKVKTPREAAVLVDEYVLTHRNVFDAKGEACPTNDTYPRSGKVKQANEPALQKLSQGGQSSEVSSDTCRYC